MDYWGGGGGGGEGGGQRVCCRPPHKLLGGLPPPPPPLPTPMISLVWSLLPKDLTNQNLSAFLSMVQVS